jgi:hypothetical protein
LAKPPNTIAIEISVITKEGWSHFFNGTRNIFLVLSGKNNGCVLKKNAGANKENRNKETIYV